MFQSLTPLFVLYFSLSTIISAYLWKCYFFLLTILRFRKWGVHILLPHLAKHNNVILSNIQDLIDNLCHLFVIDLIAEMDNIAIAG